MSCGVGCRRSSDLAFAMAVAQACSCSSDLTPCLGTCVCHRRGPKKTKKKKIDESIIHVSWSLYTYTLLGMSNEKISKLSKINILTLHKEVATLRAMNFA